MTQSIPEDGGEYLVLHDDNDMYFHVNMNSADALETAWSEYTKQTAKMDRLVEVELNNGSMATVQVSRIRSLMTSTPESRERQWLISRALDDHERRVTPKRFE